MVVSDDFGGIFAIMQWLSYVPKVSTGSYEVTDLVIFLLFNYCDSLCLVSLLLHLISLVNILPCFISVVQEWPSANYKDQ